MPTYTTNLLAGLLEADRSLLFGCAVPNLLDVAIVQALFEHTNIEQEALDGLVGLTSIFPSGEEQQRYVLDVDLREQLVAELKNEQRLLYVSLHERAFDYFARRHSQAIDEEQLKIEAEVMFHLETLFMEYIYTNELPKLAGILERTNAVKPKDILHNHTLNYCYGCLYNEQSKYGEARQIFLELVQQVDLPLVLRAKSLTALGFNCEYQGLWDRAIDAHAQSQQIYSQLDDVTGEGKAILNIGIIYHQLADFDKALLSFQESYEYFQQVGDLSLQRLALNELGYTAKELGQLDKALDFYQKGLTLCRQLQLSEFEGRFFNNLGEVYHLLCRWDEAYDHFSQALEIALDPQHRSDREAVDMLLNLGFLFHTQDRQEEALSFYQRSLNLAEEIHHQTAISQSYYLIGDLHERAGDLENAQKMYQNAIDVVETMRDNVDSEEARIGLLGIRQYVYHAMVLVCLKQNQPEMALTYVEQAKSRAFLDQVGTPQQDVDSASEQPLTAQEIQEKLSPGEALIEYFYTGVQGANQTLIANLPVQSKQLRSYLAPPDHLFVFIVTQQTVEAIELHANIQRIEAQFFDQHDGRLLGIVPIPSQQLPTLRRWQSLGQKIVDPTLPSLAGIEQLFVIPYGTLHYFPLHVLSEDATHLLPESIIYAPSASVLLKGRGRTLDITPSRTLLAVGVNTGGLQHAEEEATWIAKQLAGTALTGDDATLATVAEALRHYKIIHFACHGHFRRSNPMASGLTLFDGELSAATIWESCRFGADLVTLSACDTGLNQLTHGDELFGLMRALLRAGARSLLVTLWPVQEVATRLIMESFYQFWSEYVSAPVALAKAQCNLRTMTYPMLQSKLAKFDLTTNDIGEHLQMLSDMLPGDYPFDHPYYWAGFLLIGDL